MLVKIAPDLTDEAIGELLEVCADRGIAGVIATNTTIDRRGVTRGGAALAAEAGGLSGRPLAERALEVVRFVTSHCDLPVIGVGGISSAQDGLRMLDAGASLLQIYTGLVYSGPPLLTELNRAIARTRLTARPEGDQPLSIMEPFGARLVAAIDKRGPLCVGIDPHPACCRPGDCRQRWPDSSGSR